MFTEFECFPVGDGGFGSSVFLFFSVSLPGSFSLS